MAQAAAIAFLAMSSASLFAEVAYLRPVDGYLWDDQAPPFSPGSNETAMDTAFGSGNWADLHFETVDASVLFSSAYSFIFLEGGDRCATGLASFLATNEALIANWVSNGGSIFINAAPNQGSDINFGFGITLNYANGINTSSNNVTAVDDTHPIFNGPHGQTGSSFSGSAFGHATVSGADISPLILGEFIDESISTVVLAEANYGQGHILVGGMTLPYFHSPTQASYDLLANILAYGASPIPEPSSYAASLGMGALALIGLSRLRRQRKK